MQFSVTYRQRALKPQKLTMFATIIDLKISFLFFPPKLSAFHFQKQIMVCQKRLFISETTEIRLAEVHFVTVCPCYIALKFVCFKCRTSELGIKKVAV